MTNSLHDLPTLWRPATQQRLYRLILNAMARPGTVADLAAECAGAPALHALLATLVDHTVTLADPGPLLDERTRSLLGALDALPESASFTVCFGAQAPTFTPSVGSISEPERGTTLVLMVERVDDGQQVFTLRGPGIVGTTTPQVAGLHPAWLDAPAQWLSAPPMGVDIFLLDHQRLVALPRSTTITTAH